TRGQGPKPRRVSCHLCWARSLGHGRGRTPRRAAADLSAGRYASRMSPRGVGAREPTDPPGQDTPRPEPRYRLPGFVSGFGPGPGCGTG
ncbi:hypothetical protein AB0N28_23795, partial [Streptomyces sp. NPDC051130]